MPFIAITDAEIQSGEPISQGLMNKIKDDFDDHEARIAAGGGGGANGALGETLNGSLEADGDGDGVPDNFLVNYYPGGTGGFDTTDYVHGVRSWRFDLHGGANTGGGYLETDYIFANRYFFKPIWLAYKTSASSGVPRVQVIARCFSKARGYIGEVIVWSTVTHLSGWSLVVIHNISNAFLETEYVKLRIVGGAVDSVGVVGSVWFDAIGVDGNGMQVTVSESIVQPPVSISSSGWSNKGSVFNISIPAGRFQWLVVPVKVTGGAIAWDGPTEYHQADARCYIDSVYSSVVSSPATDPVTGNCVLYIGGMSGAKQLRFQGKITDGNGSLESSASLQKFYATNFRDVNHGAGTEADTYVKPAV